MQTRASREENRYGVRVRETAEAGPFTLGGDPNGGRARIGVLALHGFTGSPFEMRLLGEALAARGFAVEGPCLAGHHGSTRDLAATTWRDWVDSAEHALDALRARAERVSVCGLSMGGLVSLELARRHPKEVRAIALLSTALWLPESTQRFSRVTSLLPLVRKAALPKLAGSDISDPEMKRLNHRAQSDAWMPLPALASLIAFGGYARTILREVRTPALVAHSHNDHLVPFACMEAVARGLGTPPEQLKRLVLERSFHVITLDVEREQVFRAVGDFIHDQLEA
jgi:carboxylesterase